MAVVGAIPVSYTHLPDCERIENAQIGNLFYLEENLNRQCACLLYTSRCV